VQTPQKGLDTIHTKTQERHGSTLIVLVVLKETAAMVGTTGKESHLCYYPLASTTAGITLGPPRLSYAFLECIRAIATGTVVSVCQSPPKDSRRTKVDVNRASETVSARKSLLQLTLDVPERVGIVVEVEPNTAHNTCNRFPRSPKRWPMCPLTCRPNARQGFPLV
jgi:hypothetical protein